MSAKKRLQQGLRVLEQPAQPPFVAAVDAWDVHEAALPPGAAGLMSDTELEEYTAPYMLQVDGHEPKVISCLQG